MKPFDKNSPANLVTPEDTATAPSRPPRPLRTASPQRQRGARLWLIAALCMVPGVVWGGCRGERPGTEATKTDCRREDALTAQMLRKSVHLKPGIGLCYTVTEQLTVGTDIELRIDPGVRIVFDDDAGLTVHEGTLIARGTADKPILFTARRRQPGAWMGVRLMGTPSPDNALTHAIIEYGGAIPGFAGVKPANLMLDDYYGRVNLTVEDVTLRHSAGFGFYAEADTPAKFARNTMTANAQGAAYLDPAFLDHLDTDSTFTGNKLDRVVLDGATIDGQNLSWPGLKVPYVVDGDLNLINNAFVEIGPGATFLFAENTGLSVFQSRLSARGKKGRPITFSAQSEVPGYWKGVLFIDTNSVDNALEHVAIRYAGASPTYKGVEPAGVMLDDYFGKVRLKMHNTEISHSANYGLYAEEKSELDFGRNQLIDNRRAAALLHPAVVSALDTASDYRGGQRIGGGPLDAPVTDGADDETQNSDEAAHDSTREQAREQASEQDGDQPGEMAFDHEDDDDAPPASDLYAAAHGVVEVMGANLDAVQATWPAIDAAYLVRGDILVRDDAHLTLQPGSVVVFAEGSGISVYRARLTARGSADKPITFTAQSPQPGFWKGIHLVDTSSVENVFEHVTIEYGGSANTFKGAEPANLMFDDYFGLVSATLNDVTSRHSGGAGMHVEPGAVIRSQRCASIHIQGDPQLTAPSKSMARACRG